MKISPICSNIYNYKQQKVLNTKTNFNGIIARSKTNNEYYYYPFISEEDEEISKNIKTFKENNEDKNIGIVRIAEAIYGTEERCDKEIIDRIAMNNTIIYNPVKSIIK